MPRNKNDLVVQISPDVLRTAGLAAISGLRSVAGPALLSRAAARGEITGLRDTGFAALGSGGVSAVLQTLMLGEMVGDKAPFAPSRVSAGPVFGRALSGALVGSALFVSRRQRGVSGALLGALSAVAGVYAADRLRSATTQGLGLPDPVFGLLEDGLVLFGGTLLLRGEGPGGS